MQEGARFMVFTTIPATGQPVPCSEKNGLLWPSQSKRIAKYGNAAVFDSKEKCQRLIGNTIKYNHKEGSAYMNCSYKIIPVVLR